MAYVKSAKLSSHWRPFFTLEEESIVLAGDTFHNQEM